MRFNFGDHKGPNSHYQPFPLKLRPLVLTVGDHLFRLARTRPEADRYFKTLPKHRTLSDMLVDDRLWINYGPSLIPAILGRTDGVRGCDVTIGQGAFRRGKWSVLATLIHELAHVGGAIGSPSPAAERAVLACGMGSPSELKTGVDDPRTEYNPTVTGALFIPGASRDA